jgi:Methyltransferase domain
MQPIATSRFKPFNSNFIYLNYMYNRLSSHLARKLSGFHRAIEQVVYAQWYRDPLCTSPVTTFTQYMKLAEDARSKSYPEVDIFETESGFFVDRKWLDELALHTQVIVKSSPICYAHGRVLYSALARYLADNPLQRSSERVTVLETGTSRGFSALCMAKALHDLDRAGTIVTFDVLPNEHSIYWNCIDDCDMAKRTRMELLAPWSDLVQNHLLFVQGDTRLELPKVRASRVNFAFLDGAHTYEDVMFEFEQINYLQRTGDVIVYDDYNFDQFPGLVEAVDHICAKFGYSRVDISAHAGRGYVVAKKS